MKDTLLSRCEAMIGDWYAEGGMPSVRDGIIDMLHDGGSSMTVDEVLAALNMTDYPEYPEP